MRPDRPPTEAEEQAYRAKAREHEASARKLDLEAAEVELRLAKARHEHAVWLASEHMQRVYEFSGEVTDASVSACIKTIGTWARMSSDPITVRFFSPGGRVIPGLELYDYLMHIRGRGITVNTVALGWAASMAGVLLQAGERRYIGPSAWLLIHEVSAGAVGKLSEMEDEMEFAKRLQRRLLQILAERSTMTERQIERRWKRKDWWLDAQEAIRLGFADALWEQA